jgi:hypothetical protein
VPIGDKGKAAFRRDECNDASVTQAVRRILDGARYTELVRAISNRLQAEDAVNAACAVTRKVPD